MVLFRPDAPWTAAASGLKVFKISTAFGLRSTDGDLKTLISDLKRRRIPLAVELGVLVGGDRCGRTIEGYAAPTAVASLAKRIREFGGQIDYVAMDELVWFGHAAKGGPPQGRTARRLGAHFCEDPIADLVEQISPRSNCSGRFSQT